MIQMTVGAILLDNDGVLVASGDLVDVAWSRLAAEIGLVMDLPNEVVGARPIDTLGRHLGPVECGNAVATLEELELASQTVAIPGAAALVGALPNDAWAVVTSASRRLATARWRGAGLPPPKHVVAGDDVVNGKPNPEPYLAAAGLL